MEDDALPQDDAQMGRVEHFMLEMVGVLQHIAGANAVPARQGLPLEHLQALNGKYFSGVRGGDPKHSKYWLEGISHILGQMGCSNKDKLGRVVLLLTGEAHR
ncbi:hypothetical protein GOBAR_AA27885 [Gossypium barbadense]|uniref:Uncharacterized protein n=1 Tax=Gossypium barbadense TaxID=3634 RepID=A0A2P5WNW3_GOSBA|nr:hypothetical protein GOBAR_AA27885 [Gossypium barbadense]